MESILMLFERTAKIPKMTNAIETMVMTMNTAQFSTLSVDAATKKNERAFII